MNLCVCVCECVCVCVGSGLDKPGGTLVKRNEGPK